MVNNEMLQDFFEEAREMLEVLNQGILTLEQSGGGDISIVNEIFRSAHTLKGMSGMMGFNNMNHLTHKMENVLDKVRNGQMILASDQIDVLFECLDKLNHMLAEIANSSSDESIIVNDTIAKLEMLMSGTYSAESAKSAASVMSSSSSADVANIEKKNEFIDINYLKQISIPENIIKILTEYDVTKIQEYIEKDYNLYLLDFKFDEDFVSRNKSLVTFFKELSQYCEVITSSSLVEEIPSLPQFEPQQFDLDVVFIIATQLEKSEIIEKLKINNTKIKVLFEAYEYTGNDKDAKLETIEITFDGDFVTPELLQSFKEEAAEHIQEFNTCLLEIEKNINNYEKDYINIMFRAMHTLKGLANMFGLKPISEIAHKIENAIDYVRNGKIQIDSELVDLLLKNNDNLNNILSQLANSNKITNVNVDIQNKLNKYIENKINPERAENIDFDVDSSYFFETADKNKIKELLASKKNIYEIVFYYKEDFQEQIANFEVLKSKIELFGEVLGLTIAIEKIEDLEQFSYYEDFDLPLNLYFATEESISTIAMLVDKDESKIRKLEETEINKLLSQKDMQRTFGRVKKTKPKPTEKKEKNIIGGEKTVSETPKKEAIASKPQEKTNIIEKPAQKPAPVVTSPQTVSERKETAKQPAANVSTSGGGTNSGASSASVSSSTVRVDIEKLDRLMNLVGELLICKTQVEQIGLSSDLTVAENRSKLKFMTEQLGRVTNDLQEAVMKTRMVPIGTVFNRFPRVVRDIAKNRGKKVNLIIKGEETELDKTVIEEIGDPMVHLIRNAVDHGIEEPEKRRAAGKNETGNLILNAFHEGNHIIIEIEDDGAGINPEVIKRKAIEKGLATEDELKNMPDNEIVKFIFKAGFSTAEKVTDISGRGVGMDVVKSNISKINGIVDINTKVNEGTKFIIKLPLTLAIINSLLVKVADQIFAVPLASVIESVKISASDIGSIEGKYEVIKLRDSVLSVIRLNKVFDISEEENTAKKNKLFVVVIGLAEEKFALIVDELLGQQEIVIKSLNHKIVNTPGIAGATILGDGKVVLIIDVATIIANSRKKVI